MREIRIYPPDRSGWAIEYSGKTSVVIDCARNSECVTGKVLLIMCPFSVHNSTWSNVYCTQLAKRVEGIYTTISRKRNNPCARRRCTMNTSYNAEIRTHTRFSDVCGTIDELKRALAEEPERVAAEPQPRLQAIDEALFMEQRMRERVAEYEGFRAVVAAQLAAMVDLGAPPPDAASAERAALKELIEAGRVLSADECAEAGRLAEMVRAVAQDLEHTLYGFKTAALELGRAYRALEGNRRWVLDDTDAEQVPLPDEPAWSRWLPPSPHRERILRFLRSGRADLLPASPDEPPRIQFEDGGAMLLPTVRWSEEVHNFYPADHVPHPDGLRYRPSEQ
jgi:hypothetical protein